MIIGYIANDCMYRVIKSFLEKEITDASLNCNLSTLALGLQYVCKTAKACEQLEIIDKRELAYMLK